MPSLLELKELKTGTDGEGDNSKLLGAPTERVQTRGRVFGRSVTVEALGELL